MSVKLKVDSAELEPLEPIINKMKIYGIKSVRVEFYGCGDSGQIEHIDWSKEPPDGTNVDVKIETYSYTRGPDGTYNHERNIVDKRMPLEKALEEVTYSLLDKCGVDWYNNEGGGGYLEIDTQKPEGHVEFNVYYNEIVQRDGHYAEGSLI